MIAHAALARSVSSSTNGDVSIGTRPAAMTKSAEAELKNSATPGATTYGASRTGASVRASRSAPRVGRATTTYVADAFATHDASGGGGEGGEEAFFAGVVVRGRRIDSSSGEMATEASHALGAGGAGAAAASASANARAARRCVRATRRGAIADDRGAARGDVPGAGRDCRRTIRAFSSFFQVL